MDVLGGDDVCGIAAPKSKVKESGKSVKERNGIAVQLHSVAAAIRELKKRYKRWNK